MQDENRLEALHLEDPHGSSRDVEHGREHDGSRNGSSNGSHNYETFLPNAPEAILLDNPALISREDRITRVKQRAAELSAANERAFRETIERDFKKITDPFVKEGVIYAALSDLGHNHEDIMAFLEARRRNQQKSALRRLASKLMPAPRS